MDKKEIKRLEQERERLDEERARLDEDRSRLEQERERMEAEREQVEEENEGHGRRRLIVKGKLTPEEQKILDENLKKMDEGLKIMDEELKNMDFDQLKMDKIQEKMDRAQIKIEMAMDGLDEKIENSIAGIDFDKMNETVEKAMASVDKHGHDIDVDAHRVTKNVGVLNFKDITEEEIEKLGDIKNTGVIIVPEEFMSKISAKIIKNIGTVVPYKKGWRIYSGHTEIDSSMLEAIDEPLEFIQTGHLDIAEDVTSKLIKAKIKAFHNYGHVQATEETYGVLMAKCMENYGHISKNGHDEDE